MRRRRAPSSGDGRPCIVGGAAACLRRAVGNRVRSRQRRNCCCECRSPRPAVYGGRWGIECAAANVGEAAAIVDLPTGLLFTAAGGESRAQPHRQCSVRDVAACLGLAMGNRRRCLRQSVFCFLTQPAVCGGRWEIESTAPCKRLPRNQHVLFSGIMEKHVHVYTCSKCFDIST